MPRPKEAQALPARVLWNPYAMRKTRTIIGLQVFFDNPSFFQIYAGVIAGNTMPGSPSRRVKYRGGALWRGVSHRGMREVVSVG